MFWLFVISFGIRSLKIGPAKKWGIAQSLFHLESGKYFVAIRKGRISFQNREFIALLNIFLLWKEIQIFYFATFLPDSYYGKRVKK